MMTTSGFYAHPTTLNTRNRKSHQGPNQQKRVQSITTPSPAKSWKPQDTINNITTILLLQVKVNWHNIMQARGSSKAIHIILPKRRRSRFFDCDFLQAKFKTNKFKEPSSANPNSSTFPPFEHHLNPTSSNGYCIETQHNHFLNIITLISTKHFPPNYDQRATSKPIWVPSVGHFQSTNLT